MLKTLIKIRLQGLFYRQVRGSKKKTSSLWKIILIGLLLAYAVVVFMGFFGYLFDSLIEPFHMIGIDWLYFGLMALFILVLCFVGSVFITYNEIYEGKDNELLLSLPIKNHDILLSRVFTILILNYILEALVALPACYVYITNIGMSLLQLILFILTCITLPFFILALSCFFGWILGNILVRIPNKNIVVLVLYIIFFFAYFRVVYSLQESVVYLLSSGETIASAIEHSVFPLYHLSIALEQGNIISFLIYLVFVIVPFVVVLYLLSTNFIKLATTKAKVKKKVYHRKPMETRSIYKALLVREWKHFSSSAMIMLNDAIGVLFMVVATIGLIVYREDIQEILRKLYLFQDYFTPILCLMMLYMSSMNIISASSISLEGNRLWLLKALPIEPDKILNMKLLFHFIICVPPTLLFAIAASWILQIGLFESYIVIITPIIFILFVDLAGLLINLWKPKFDYINETVCVKQSMSVVLTLLLSVGIMIIITVLYFIFIQDFININTYVYLILLLFVCIDALLYYILHHWGVAKFNRL